MSVSSPVARAVARPVASPLAGTSFGDGVALAGIVTADDYTVNEGNIVTLTFEDTSIAGVVTASDYTVNEGNIVTLEFNPVANTYQWIDENGDDIVDETTVATEWPATAAEQPPRMKVTNPTSGQSKIFRVDSPIDVQPAVYLLDTVLNAISIWSKRILKSGQTQSMLVRRASDSATQEIGFVGDWLDAASLLTFGAGDDVFVVTLYDASGNAVNPTQVTEAAQPQILTAGVPTSLTDYSAAIAFDGSDDILSTPNVAWGSVLTAIFAAHSMTGGDKISLCSGSTTSGAEQTWYAGMTEGLSKPRVGTADAGPAYNLWDHPDALGRNAVGAIFDLAGSPQVLPILGETASAAGWTNTLAGVATGAFDELPMRIGGNTVAFSTAPVIGHATFSRGLTAGELSSVVEALGIYRSGVFVGDSTTAAYAESSGTFTFVATDADTFRTNGFYSIAVAGHTIAQQKTAWQAAVNVDKLEWVSVMIGLNDMNPAIATATTIAALQDLIDTIRADVSASCKILLLTMTPAYACSAWIGWGQAGAQAKWNAVNDAIMNRGASPITGVDGRLEQHTLDLTEAGTSPNNELDPAYQIAAPDEIHPNDTGRAIVADHVRTSLRSLGFF